MSRPVGVDLGGSSVRAVADPLSTPQRLPVGRADSLDVVLDALCSVALGASDSSPGPVVVAIPSFVDAGGSVLECPAVPALTGVPLASVLTRRLGAPIDVVPDLAAAAIGESVHGCGRGVRRFLCVAIGTGVNAAAVVDGSVVDTAYGCLGDAGHVFVDPDGPECACGGRGCLESVASGHALARLGSALGYADAADVAGAAGRGDEPAAALMGRAGTALGRAISTWSVLLWPDLVAVAGGVAQAGELLLEPARAELVRVGPPYVTRGVRVELAQLGDRATVVGALHLAQGSSAR